MKILSLILSVQLIHASAGLVATCQSKGQVGASGSNTTTTSAVDTTGATLLVVMATTFNTAVCSGTISDNKGNTWHCVHAYTVAASTQASLFYAWDHGGTALSVGSGHTVSFQQNTSFVGITFRAFSGTYTWADPLRTQNGGGQSSGATLATGSITPTKGDLVVTGLGDAGGSGYTVDLTTDCVAAYSAGNNIGVGIGYQLTATGSAINQTWSSLTGASVATIAAFKTTPVFTGTPLSVITPPLVPVETATFADSVTTTGDTQFFTWAASGTKAGNWSGGDIVGMYNDGNGYGCGSSNVCLYDMTAYVAGTSVTTGSVNTMTSYGGSSSAACYDGVLQMKTRKGFFFNGALFIPIVCIDGSNHFTAKQAGFIVSPDGGAHWCNYKSFNAHAVSPDCDSSNWKATGDNPVDAAGFQWPIGDNASPDTTNKMTRMQIVDFMCQDNNVNCSVAPGVDSSYLYFITTKGTSGDNSFGPDYLLRIPKAGGWKGVMALTNAQVRNGTGWDATFQNATAISGSLVFCCGTVNWLANFNLFVTWQHVGGGLTTSTYATSTVPWGPFTTAPTFSFVAQVNFPSLVPALCPKLSGSNVTCTFATNGGSSSTLNLTEVTLGKKALIYTSVQ